MDALTTLPPPDATQPWGRIYVALLTKVAPHPHADHEVVVAVDAGWGQLTVVTGGPHVAVGRKVAVAPVGVPLAAWLDSAARAVA
jgi:tRNA-binding EMAP/Myf-like protein